MWCPSVWIIPLMSRMTFGRASAIHTGSTESTNVFKFGQCFGDEHGSLMRACNSTPQCPKTSDCFVIGLSTGLGIIVQVRAFILVPEKFVDCILSLPCSSIPHSGGFHTI